MGVEGGELGVPLQKHTSIETPPWTRHHILGRTRGSDGCLRVWGQRPVKAGNRVCLSLSGGTSTGWFMATGRHSSSSGA